MDTGRLGLGTKSCFSRHRSSAANHLKDLKTRIKTARPADSERRSKKTVAKQKKGAKAVPPLVWTKVPEGMFVDEMGPQYRAEVSDGNEVVVTYDLMPIVKGGYNVCRTSAWDGKVTTLERGPVPLAKARQIAADDDANS
jgi:hypothetical protein